MEGYWKMLDNMSDKDPKAYNQFIEKQMGDMNEHREQENMTDQVKRTINSDCYFSFSMRPIKVLD
jgi:hypothetical protein